MASAQKVKQAKAAPTKKVTIGGLAGALSAILVWALNQYAGAQIPGEIGSAITTVFTFVVAYLVPPAPSDNVVPAGEGRSVAG